MQPFNHWLTHGTPTLATHPFEPLTAPGDEFHTHTLSMDEQTLMLPQSITLQQPTWVLCNVSPRLKSIGIALNTPVAKPNLEDGYVPYPITCFLKHVGANENNLPSIDIIVVTTALPMHPQDAVDIIVGEPKKVGEWITGFPIAANELERFQLWYRKYAGGFMQIAEPSLPKITDKRSLSWDTLAKEKLPVHVLLDGFEDLANPLFTSLGDWGPCMGAQFLKCPPEEPSHCELLHRVGKLFDLDLYSKLTPAYYLILNQFDWTYPKPMVMQSLDLERDILMRMVHVFYMCILPVFGSLTLSIVGYKDITVPEGKLLIMPARLWVVAKDMGLGAGTTITLAF